MDTRTGELLTEEEAKERERILREAFGHSVERIIQRLPNSFIPTQRQLKTKKIERNDRCPCGSGRKFKKCCMTRR